MSNDTDTLVDNREAVQVEAWLLRQWYNLGASPEQTDAAMSSNIDYHDVEKLVKAGCDITLALQICF
jgi:hypothetical protein